MWSAVDIIADQWLAVDGNGKLRRGGARFPATTKCAGSRACRRRSTPASINRDFDRAVLSSILSTAARRTAAIDRIVAFVEKKGDDEVDL